MRKPSNSTSPTISGVYSLEAIRDRNAKVRQNICSTPNTCMSASGSTISSDSSDDSGVRPQLSHNAEHFDYQTGLRCRTGNEKPMNMGVEMEQTSSKQNEPPNSRSPARTWEEVAKEIISESDSEKLSFLVKELCEILDSVPKGPGGLHPQDFSARESARIS
jgi:hypothetical protein